VAGYWQVAGVDSVREQEKLEASLPWRARPGKNACLHLAAHRPDVLREAQVKMPQNPTRQVHALLAGFYQRYEFSKYLPIFFFCISLYFDFDSLNNWIF
jgi:hypothetical protein